MRQIFRYAIPLDAEYDFEIEMPKGEKRVVLVALQDRAPHNPCMWVECEYPEEKPIEVKFYVRGTGQGIPMGARHVGTWQERGFVWHLYADETSMVHKA